MNSSGGTNSPSTADRKIRHPRRRWWRARGGVPSTPLLHWTFYYNNKHANKKHHLFSSCTGPGAGGRHVELSARKLAAGLWQLRCSAERLRSGSKRRARSSDRFCSGIQSLPSRSKSVIEGTTKWDSRCSKTSTEAYCFLSHMKRLQDQVIKIVSFVSALRAELVQAQLSIHDLQSEVRSSRENFKYLLKKKHGEQTIMSQQKKEDDNIYALVDDLRGQLSRERKKQQRMEILNSRLVKELAEAKLSAMQLHKDYEAEKRTRELMEEVCNQLAKKIGEDKAEFEALRIETTKIQEEMEEERKMLQMAEVWREERVQMKLIDAKLALESKYSQMNKLITMLETFLRSRSTSLEVTELRQAELISQAVKSVCNIQDIEEVSDDEPLTLGDMFSKFEEPIKVEVCEREVDDVRRKSVNCSSNGDPSSYHPVSPEKNEQDNDHVPKNSSGFVDQNSGMERVEHAENQGSSYSIEESGPSSNREICETSSISAQQSNLKTSSAKLRISCPSSSGSHKAISEEGNGRFFSRPVTRPWTIFSKRKSVKGGLQHQNSVGQWGLTNLVNPHIARGMKGGIEWPRGKRLLGE